MSGGGTIATVKTALLLVALALLTSSCGQEDKSSTAAVKCPIRYDSDFDDYDLSDRMSPARVKACQEYFALRSADKRFTPGSPSFSTSFCNANTRRASACQQVRVAVCQLRVRAGRFATIGRCLAGEPVRQVVARRVGVSLAIPEPWFFDIGWGMAADIEIDHLFRTSVGRVSFVRAASHAWSAHDSQRVPFPADLGEFLADNPYLDIHATTPISLGRIVAQQIDLVTRGGDPVAMKASLCGEYGLREEPCVPISADSDSEGYASLYLDPMTSYRLIDVKAPKGRLIIVVDDFDHFDQLSELSRIFETLKTD